MESLMKLPLTIDKSTGIALEAYNAPIEPNPFDNENKVEYVEIME